jgi:plastocyanin
VVKNGGDGQSWYVNNPLPAPLSVIVRDANNCPVPGAAIDWSIVTGGGGLSPTHNTTSSSGVATTGDSVGSVSPQVVRATSGALPAQDFTATASAAPTTGAVEVRDNNFNPTNVVVQSGGAVTWNRTGSNQHNVTFGSGPTTPAKIFEADLATGNAASRTRTLTAVGTYNYTCTNHAGMSGTITVVH